MKPFFGVRAHDFGTLPAEELAPNIASSGATCVQLALAKALPGSHLLPSEFGENGIENIRKSFNENGITVSVLGCYIDMVTTDLSQRENDLVRFERHIDAAATLGCRIVGTETGSPAIYLHHANGREIAFQVAMQSLHRLVKYAEQKGIYVGLEPVTEFHAISSAEHARIIIEEFNSPALGIIFDPVNLIPSDGIEDMNVFLDECFDAFGGHIVAVHAKDYRMIASENGLKKSSPLPAGSGDMDWEGLFSRLIQAGKDYVPILLEEAGPADAVNAFAKLQKAWDNAVEKFKS